ncbi:MAG TPA: hypothetical protein VNB54_03290 [Alphaproteobacteria bacterium]|nr:hypothetical protein [Alphaproteobacteria bacterium]
MTTIASRAAFIDFSPRSDLLEQLIGNDQKMLLLMPEAKLSLAHVNGKPVQSLLP